jgi:tight adherence protein B
MTLDAHVLAVLIGLMGGAGLFLLVLPARPFESAETSIRNARLGVDWKLVTLAVTLAVGGGLATFLVTGVVGLGLAAAFVGATAPVWWRSRMRVRHERAVEGCYPDLIEGLIAQVRSGATLMRGLARAASSAPHAVAAPAAHFWSSVQVSGDASACLDELKTQWASPTGDLLVEAVRVAHDVGGAQVIDVLRELADQVRRDRNVRREIEAKQSWVRVAARVGVAAPWVVLVLLSFRSEAAHAYNSPVGLTLIVCGLALSIVAYRLMLTLGRSPISHRVFAA